MFWHNFKYEFLSTVRQKEVVFWMLLFPIILGTFFHLAFGDIYEKTETFNQIPIMVVENIENDTFKQALEELSKSDDALFTVKYASEEDALQNLKDKNIDGIIYVDDEFSLKVSKTGIQQTIIKSFLDQYKVQETIIKDVVKTNPQNLPAVIEKLSNNIECNENVPLSNGNMDYMIQYFYNLIAMVSIFGSMTGLFVATSNQANLSAIGARKCVSPTHKMKSIISSLLASYIVHLFCVVICITYLLVVLKVDLGTKILMVYLSGAVGGLTGVTMGFFIGSFGKMSLNAKSAIAMTASMTGCFLSGLMVGNMKAVISEYCPIVNKINPPAVISDTFYCLNIYDDYTRYTQNIIILLIMSAVFTLGGFLLTRRTKYASL